MTDFAGFPVSALDFYDDLELDNTKSFWEAHKETYRTAVREPMAALTKALAGEFGEAKIFRPYRDVRFAKDKTPYKTHQGAFVAAGPATGWYVEISAAGLRTIGGFYDASPAALAAVRRAIDDPRTGIELERLVDGLRLDGWQIGGTKLKTRPRDYDSDHPRIDLLRHKSLTVGRSHGFEPVIHTPEILDLVRSDWQRVRALIEWIALRTSGT